jgi:hypothetical protein
VPDMATWEYKTVTTLKDDDQGLAGLSWQEIGEELSIWSKLERWEVTVVVPITDYVRLPTASLGGSPQYEPRSGVLFVLRREPR